MKIEQNWKIQVIKDNPTYPFIVIDNWYTPNEEKAIWKELDFLGANPREQQLRAEETLVARNKDGSPKSNAYRWYPGDLFKDGTISPIHNCMYKQRTPEFHNIIKECVPYSRSYLSTNDDSTLISYYEDNDHYHAHHDVFSWTCLIWFVREPRLFTGGDFDFPETGYEVKLKHNRMVMFPSCYLHRVSPVKFNKQPKEFGYGRYTITHFYLSNPTNIPQRRKV